MLHRPADRASQKRTVRVAQTYRWHNPHALLAALLLIESVQHHLPLLEFTDGVTTSDVAYAATIGVVAVTGFETAATLAGETR